MIQDRHVVTGKVKQQIIYTISNGNIADDHGWPLLTPISLPPAKVTLLLTFVLL